MEEMLMQIQSLRYFIELARCGSFYAAAKNSFISQQGMNRAISSLESEMDLTLVERSRNGIRLTRDGELFLEYAERMVSEYDSFARELFERKQPDNQEGDPITLYVSHYAALIASADPRYVQLLAKHSSYLEEPFDKLVQRAKASDGTDLVFLDLHFHQLGEYLQNPDLVFEPFLTTRVGFVWKEGSPLASEPLLHREAISGYPVALSANRETALLAERLFEQHPLRDVRMRATSPRLLLQYVQSSEQGVAFFDSFGFYLAKQHENIPTEGLRFTPLSTPQSFCQVGFLYPRRIRLTLHARNTMNTLRNFLDEMCADYFAAYPINVH